MVFHRLQNLFACFNISNPAPCDRLLEFDAHYPMTEPAITPEFVQNALPHSERIREPLLSSDGGKWIFESIFAALKNKTVAQAA